MKIASTCIVVRASLLGVEVRLIAGSQLAGKLTVRHEDVANLVERLQVAAAQVVAVRHADSARLDLK